MFYTKQGPLKYDKDYRQLKCPWIGNRKKFIGIKEKKPKTIHNIETKY